MPGKIQKLLAKLSQAEFRFVMNIVEKLTRNDFMGLDIKKLEGQSDIFRLKKGNFRIIFSKTGSVIHIISIARRSEKTYRDF